MLVPRFKDNMHREVSELERCTAMEFTRVFFRTTNLAYVPHYGYFKHETRITKKRKKVDRLNSKTDTLFKLYLNVLNKNLHY